MNDTTFPVQMAWKQLSDHEEEIHLFDQDGQELRYKGLSVHIRDPQTIASLKKQFPQLTRAETHHRLFIQFTLTKDGNAKFGKVLPEQSWKEIEDAQRGQEDAL